MKKLQQLYNVPVLKMYDSSSIDYPKEMSQENPFNRNCSGVTFDFSVYSAYAQAYRLQTAYELAMDYARHCNIDWTYIVRTR